ncbi:MAG: RNA-guided pseudouridylation complex pseudouridine synthase subunit Cbf5 [Candidatus Jordarchaeales archaeon]
MAIGSATKLVQALHLIGKEYVCVMRLHGDVDPERVQSVCKEFIGPIYQRPPIRSSVKRRLRVRQIYYLDVLEIEGRNVLLKVGCESGTYIRKLCHDIGEVLGCGAHMRELRRTRSGPFTEDNIVTLHDLKDAYVFWKEEKDETYIRKVLLPLETGVQHLPKFYVRDSTVDAICHGADLAIPGIVKVEDGVEKGDVVAILTLKGELVALGTAMMTLDEVMREKRGIAVKTKRVVMEKGTYPKLWKSKKESNKSG